MKQKVRWGILGTAKIAREKVIPGMQSGSLCDVAAIASRDLDNARKVAEDLGIPQPYGSYDGLLADPEIDAVYIPLPNNMHFEWTARAAKAGKHVLCEKPIGLDADEVRRLIEVRDNTGCRIQEAFMVRTHPTWIAVKEVVGSGRIGKLRAVTGFFSYFNDDKSNIRNKLEMGGGAMLDIGCYCVSTSRLAFDAEPEAVAGFIERDEESGIDRLSSAVLLFPNGHAAFTCSTQLVPYQRMQIFGTKARLEVQIPFNIPLDTPTKLFIDDGKHLYGEEIETIEFEPANQYEIQGDLFSKAILEGTEEAVPLEDSFNNMSVLDALFRSARTGRRETPASL